MLAWSWIAIMSLAIAWVAGRQLIVVERQRNVMLLNTAQTMIDVDHEKRIGELEHTIKRLVAHETAAHQGGAK